MTKIAGRTRKQPEDFFAQFFAMESAGGIVLFLAAVAAMVLANSPLKEYYDMLLSTIFQVRIGDLGVAKPLLLWINDGLMAIFFCYVGLELKREFVEGELSRPGSAILPAVGAVGGMAVPALIFFLFNHDNEQTRQGWAIPAATDIAFALGVLALLGSKIPTSIKVFLTSLAIFDDIGAIVIIAFFYSHGLAITPFVIAIVAVAVLFILNRTGVTATSPYIMTGAVMWLALLKSGVHATLAGLLMAFFIPIRPGARVSDCPLKELEHDLHVAVTFFVLPVFAFFNAGIYLGDVSVAKLTHEVTLGIAFGLVLGKQLGIFTFCYLAAKIMRLTLPVGMNWLSLYGASLLCGIGFTMSLFIGSLAFEERIDLSEFDERLGIVLGSLVSGIVGYFILRRSFRSAPEPKPKTEQEPASEADASQA